MFINWNNLYKWQLQYAGDAYGYPLDMVPIAHAGPIVSKTLATGLVSARPPCLREPHHIHPNLLSSSDK